MKRIITFFVILILAFSLSACGDTTSGDTSNAVSNSNLNKTRQEVVDKMKNEPDDRETELFLDAAYKQYPDDETIANVYYYRVARSQYDKYLSSDNNSFLMNARLYVNKFDPNYSGPFADEMHALVDTMISKNELEEKQDNAPLQKDENTDITNNESAENSGTSGSDTNYTASHTDSGVRHTNADAFTIAEYIVKDYLKAPSTASFCKVYEATITNDGDVYTVEGWVDAQNSFGAMIRQNFTVTYTAIKDGNDIGYKNGSATFS